jgi:transposase-like protein
LRKNGSSKGKAKYGCMACRHQAVFAPATPARAARYAQVEKRLLERVSQRAIVRLTGVARMTVVKRAKKSPPATEERSASASAEGTGTGRAMDVRGPQAV